MAIKALSRLCQLLQNPLVAICNFEVGVFLLVVRQCLLRYIIEKRGRLFKGWLWNFGSHI